MSKAKKAVGRPRMYAGSGRTIPVGVSLPPEVVDALDREAERRGMSRSRVAAEWLAVLAKHTSKA